MIKRPGHIKNLMIKHEIAGLKKHREYLHYFRIE